MLSHEDEVAAANRRSLADWNSIFTEILTTPRRIPIGTLKGEKEALAATLTNNLPHNLSISKTALEQEIFFANHKVAQPETEARLSLLGERGSQLHRLVYTLLDSQLKQMSVEQTLTRVGKYSRAYKRLAMDRFLSDGQLSAANLDHDLETATRLAENITAAVGEISEVYTEVSFDVPIVMTLGKQIGKLTSRADAIVIGEKGSCIVDFKTGKKFDQGQILFNLVILAIEWEVAKLVTANRKARKRWGGKKIECRSPKHLTAIEPNLDTTLMLVWDNYVVTDSSCDLTPKEIELGITDINEKILDIFFSGGDMALFQTLSAKQL